VFDPLASKVSTTNLTATVFMTGEPFLSVKSCPQKEARVSRADVSQDSLSAFWRPNTHFPRSLDMRPELRTVKKEIRRKAKKTKEK